jgi:hypothetical protein
MTDVAEATKERKRSDRTTIGLSEDATKTVDSLILQEVRKVKEAGGVGVAPSRGQIVEALIRNAHTAHTAAS